jgi:GAF domain-containing protein
MFDIESLKKLDQKNFYESIILFAKGLIEGERDSIANLANISSLLYQTMSDVNWAGFYFMREGELVLGPFHGNPACIRIQVGSGVCGNAVSEDKTQLVKDVHKYPGHIACDGATNSEIVIPIHNEGQIVAVLDIDSPVLNRFNEEDKANLEKFVKLIEDGCDWGRY